MDYDKIFEKWIKWWFEMDEYLMIRVYYKDSVFIFVFDVGLVYFFSFGFFSDIILCSIGKKLEYLVLYIGIGFD